MSEALAEYIPNEDPRPAPAKREWNNRRGNSVDRLPPHSPEGERGVLGCVLLSPRETLPEVQAKFRSRKEAFYDLRHQTIFNTFIELQDEGVPLDVISVMQRLKDRQLLEEVGGTGYLAGLPDEVPSAANLSHYLDIVFEKWVLRRTIQTCTDVVTKVFDYEGESAQLVAQVQDAILSLPTAEEGGAKPLKSYGGKLLDRVEHYARGVGVLTGRPTGYRYWDRLCGGLQDCELYVIGGRPSLGKTSLAMNVAERVAVDGHAAVGVLSLEMNAVDLILRMVCARTQTNFHKFRTGCATSADLDIVRAALPVALDEKQCPIYIDDTGGLTLFDMRARLRAMKHRYGIKLAIIDYLQLAQLSREWRGDPVRGYGEIAKGLKDSAKELGIPIILLSQLSRESEKRGSKPRMSDLRESGDIEQAADFIGILWSPPLPKEEEQKLRDAVAADPMGQHTLAVEMEICKNRNGPSGTGMRLNFLRWCMRFEDLQYPKKDENLGLEEP